MAISEFESKKWEKELAAYIDTIRPPVHIRNEIDIGYRIDGQSIFVFEIRPSFQNPNERVEIPVIKGRYYKSRKEWTIYWQRADLKWHIYEPYPSASSLTELLNVLKDDEYNCFWG